MTKHRYLLKGFFTFLIACSTAANAATVTWTAQSPNNDMNNPANWTPNTIPGSGDEAVFDSTISRISTNPVENSAPFSVSVFNFANLASAFTFNFNNETLTFNGAGITGTQTNTTIHVINTDNSSFPGNLISFLGSTGTSGSADITSANNATLSGNHSNTNIGSINSNFYSSGPFTIADDGKITASNTGNDSTNGTGNNGTANTGSSQLGFDQSFTAGNNVAVSVSNSGTFSGNNTVQGDAVSIVNGSQFISSGTFQVGDNFNCDVTNMGNDSSTGVGLSNIGQINSAQMLLQNTGTAGNNCTITISNSGINSSQTTEFSDFIGYLNDQQFFAGSTFQAGSNFSLTVSNTGTDTSSGHGAAQVSVINSNSGSTGNQILFQEGGTFADHASITATNSGSYSGTNTGGGPNVGGMNLQQIAIGDSTAPGSYSFNAGDYFSLSASNTGTDSGIGTGSDAVGDVSSDQITFYTPCSLGSNAQITLTNTGISSGQASSSYINVGSTGNCQLNCVSTFQASDNFTLNVSNSGTHSASGAGYNFIGDLIDGQQVSFQDGFVIGNNGSISISNSGSNSSSTVTNNQVGSMMGYGKQLFVEEQFQAGDNFQLNITNTGFDDSTGAGGNFTGFINNDTADGSASQLHLNAGGSLGNQALITISNKGTYQGNNTGSNATGALSGPQFYSVSDFHAEDNLSLTASNMGIDNASGQNNNSIGSANGPQIEFSGACVLGNNAYVDLSNNGENNDATGTSNTIGYIGGSQLMANGNFTAGTNLTLNASNSGTNAGDSSNIVGHISGNQLFFAQSCTLNDKTTITALNSGAVADSQIVFGQGFDIASGKAFIQAINNGSVGSFGIDIQGSNEGGNAQIFLGNSSLNIGTTLPTFTIAGLIGDSTSLVQSQPTLIINTDASTQTEFSGVVQDFPATISTLMKTGPGTQKLSGDNTYTGLTTVQEGTLIVNGSIAGDVLLNPLGTLKGAGAILGTVTSTGIIAPGESIGTLTVGNYINNGGNYDVEVNGLGQSDLIDATGTATLNGGTVVVSSVDGTYSFQQPYTILTADGGVAGTFADAASLALIAPTLTYDPNNVYLTLQPALIKAAESCNQYGVARSLDNISSPSAEQSLLISSVVNLPLEDARKALETLSGFQYTNDVWVTEISTRRFLRRLYDPLRSLVTRCDCCSPCETSCSEWTTWLETGDGYTKLNGKKAHKVHMNSYQVTGGIQKNFCGDLTFGLAGSYEYDHIKYRNGKSNRNSELLAAYGLYRPSFFYGLFDLIYGHSSNNLSRTIHLGDVHHKAHSKPDLNTFAFYGEAGYDMDYGCFLVQPFIGLQAGKTWREHFHENKANGWGLAIHKHDWTSTSSRLGLHLSTCNFCGYVDASLDLAWNYLWQGRKSSNKGRFKQFGDAFRICGNHLDKNSLDYALTLTSCLCEGFKGYLELDGEWWQHAHTFDITGGIEYSW